jgi:hypothetical protein
MRTVTNLVLLALAGLLFAGCGDTPLKAVTSSLENTNGNFQLFVSNQSFAINPVDIAVSIDGTPVLQKYFDVGNQHSFYRFVFELPPGQHRITAKSSKGNATLDRSFTVEGKQSGTLFFWYYPKGDGDTPRHFSFEVKGGTPLFM